MRINLIWITGAVIFACAVVPQLRAADKPPELPAELRIEALEFQTQAIAAERDYWQHEAARLKAVLDAQAVEAKRQTVEAKMRAACGDKATFSRDANNRPACVAKPEPKK